MKPESVTVEIQVIKRRQPPLWLHLIHAAASLCAAIIALALMWRGEYLAAAGWVTAGYVMVQQVPLGQGFADGDRITTTDRREGAR